MSLLNSFVIFYFKNSIFIPQQLNKHLPIDYFSSQQSFFLNQKLAKFCINLESISFIEIF